MSLAGPAWSLCFSCSGRSRARPARCPARQPVIDEKYLAGRGQAQVSGLDVEMGRASLVEIVEGPAGGLQPDDDVVGRQRAVLLQQLLQAGAGHEVADQVLADPFQGKMVAHGRDLGVGEVAEAARLRAEALLYLEIGVQIFFEGDLDFVVNVPGVVDGAVGALPEQAGDTVALVDDLAGEVGHRFELLTAARSLTSAIAAAPRLKYNDCPSSGNQPYVAVSLGAIGR